MQAHVNIDHQRKVFFIPREMLKHESFEYRNYVCYVMTVTYVAFHAFKELDYEASRCMNEQRISSRMFFFKYSFFIVSSFCHKKSRFLTFENGL